MYRRGSEKHKGTTGVQGEALSVSIIDSSPGGRAKEVFRYFGNTKFFDGLKNYVFPKN